jgi:beta-galactosidase
MKKNHLPLFILLLAAIAIFHGSCNNTRKEVDRTASFDSGWRFIKDNPAGAEDPAFDDSNWRLVDLPHDWSIEDLPDQGDSIIGPFAKSSIGKMSTGYTVGGTAWYRKTFTLDKKDKDKIVYLNFDGVYMNADVWINGKHAGNHPYGYTSFYYDITSYLNPAGEPNVVAVQVKNVGLNTRWYSGSGIYRHTWLTVTEPLHIGVWGVFVTTPVISEKSAEIAVQSTIINSGNEIMSFTLQTQIIDPSGKIAGTITKDTTLNSGESVILRQNKAIDNPALWSLEDPKLYTAKVTILSNNKETDTYSATFGIRSIKFDALTGFTLNGKSIKLKGGCYHHDNGPLGSAAIDRAEERKIELLKKAGYNAIRCSHNPPSPYLLEACDSLGMLVIDEAFDMWEKPKNRDDYSVYFKDNWKKDVESMVLRDRNHPSIIMWSIGNEIPEAGDTSGFRIARALNAAIRDLDQTRGVTEAMVDFAGMSGGKSDWDDRAPHMALFEAVGYNYGYTKYEQDHQKFPERVIFASESMPPFALENWQKVEKLPYVFGDFTWTAMDYLGEAGVGIPRLIDTEVMNRNPGANVMGLFFARESWPVFNDFQGDLDLIGNPKAPYYYRHVVWRESKIEMLVHRPILQGKSEIASPWGFPDELKSWTWPGHENEKLQIHVYTRSKLVRLELNGKVVGEQKVDGESSITATFEVPYVAGTLTARCFDGKGTEIASETIKTTGEPATIRLVADRSEIRADRNDLSYVMVEILDAEGNLVTNADEVLVSFEISGSGEIAGVGNGSPDDMSSFQQPRKKSWQGKCLAIIRPRGDAGIITLKATAEGLKEATINLTCK